MKQKGRACRQAGLAPILIIVLIAVLAVGGYLIYKLPRTVVIPQTPQTTPAPSPTPNISREPNGSAETANPDPIGANWKTYEKNKLWTVKYPPSWHINQDDEITGVNFSDSGNISIKITWAEGNNSYDERLSRKVGQSESANGNTYTTYKRLNIDGYPAVIEQLELVHNGPAKPMYLYQTLIKGPLNVNITASAIKYNQQGFSKENYNKIYFPIIDQILSTFKFIN